MKKKTKKHTSNKLSKFDDSRLFKGLRNRGVHGLAGRDLMIQYLELYDLTDDVLSFIDEHKDA